MPYNSNPNNPYDPFSSSIMLEGPWIQTGPDTAFNIMTKEQLPLQEVLEMFGIQTSPLTGLSGSLQSQQQQPQVTAQPVYPQGGPVQQPQVFAQPEYPPIKQQQPQATAQPVFRKPVYPQPPVAQQHHQLTSQDMWSYPPEARFVLSRNCLARTTQQITPADADEYARYIAGDRDAILMRRTGKRLAELVASARS